MKTAVITGGANGIGNALAHLLVSSYDLHVLDRVEANVGTTHITDVSSLTSVESALSSVDSVELVILCAGVMRRGTMFESSESDFDLLYSVNVKGYWTVLKALSERLAENATVLFISSRHASVLPIDPALYALTKRANADMAILLSQTRPDLIVKTAFLGPVETAISKEGVSEQDFILKRQIAISPGECAELLFSFLCSHESTLTYKDGKYV